MAWITRIWAKYQNKRYSLSSNLSPFESKTVTQHQQQHSLLSSLSFTSIWLFSSASQSYNKPVSSPNLSFFTLNGNTMLLHLSFSLYQYTNQSITPQLNIIHCASLSYISVKNVHATNKLDPTIISFVTQGGHNWRLM